MPLLKVNDIQLNVEIHGEGEPLVLISGIGYSLWQWHKMVPILQENFKVITFDNRGVGKTDKPTGPYTASLLASDVAGLLLALDISSAAVLGHSMGGFIAQAFALEYPHLLSKLILCSTNFGGPRHVPVTPDAMLVLSDTTSDPLTRFRNGLRVSTAHGFADEHPEIIQAWLEWRIANPVDIAGYQAQFAIGLGLLSAANSFEHRLKNITAPTLIMFGEHDRVVPPANAGLLSEQIPGSQVVILPGAGHFFPIEVPEAASEEVRRFLQK